MGPPPPGFRLVWDVAPLDTAWVLLPGLVLCGLCASLLALRWRRAPGQGATRRGLGLLTVFLFLGAVWWTLGGLGAWRMGVGRLRDGTADFVEGTLEAPVHGPGGSSLGFVVRGRRFCRAWDAFAPALHAARWPSVPLAEGQRVRLWFFGEDVLRLEVAEGP
jgi:hypothetical protein